MSQMGAGVGRSRVWGVAKQLCEGERVEVLAADRDRTLTVTQEARRVDRRPYRYDALLVSFEGYGTEYTLEVPVEDRPATLHYPSGDAIGELVRDIQYAEEGEKFAIVAEQTAADLGIPEQ